MSPKAVVTTSGSLLSLAGLVLLATAGNDVLMGLFGGQPLQAAASGDNGWIGVAFTRVCGAAVGALGLLMIASTRLDEQAAKTIGGPLFVGLALLTIVTAIQAKTIWATLAGWGFAAVLLAGCAGATRLTKRGPGPPQA